MSEAPQTSGAPVRLWIATGAICAAFFAAPVKALTGIPELMLVPDAILYLVAMSLLPGLIRRPPRGLALMAFAALAAFFLIAAAQLFNPNVPSLRIGLEGFRKTALTSAGLFLGMMLFRDIRDFERALFAVAAVASICALYAIKQAFHWGALDRAMIEGSQAGYWTSVGWGGRFRAVGTLAGPFHLGIMGIQLFCLGRYFQVRKGSSLGMRIFGFAAMFLGAAATLASQTRTNAGYLILLGGAFVLFTERSPARILGYQAAGVAALSLLALAIATDRAGAFGDAMATLADPLSDRRFLTRFREAGEIADAIGARAFRAYGMGAAGDTMDRYFPKPRVHFTTHNLALKLMIEMGVLGLAAFLAMLAAWAGRSIWNFWNRRRDPAPARAALACAALVLPVLTAGIIGTGIEAYPMNVLMWIGLGAVFLPGAEAGYRPESSANSLS